MDKIEKLRATENKHGTVCYGATSHLFLDTNSVYDVYENI
jgi:hypothetical protein